MSDMTCCGVDLDGDWPEGYVPLEAVVIMKCLDEDGDVTLMSTASPGLTSWEALGMVDRTHRVLLDALANTTEEG